MLKTKINGRIKVNRHYSILPKVTCKPGEINQVYLNLVQNAIEAIDRKGEITISTGLRHEYVEITVADTGRGISKDKLRELFDFCFTTGASRVKLGMGLATCANIIHGHGGEIKAESQPGKGSVFTISLPLEKTKTAI